MINEYQKIKIECKRKELNNFGISSEMYKKKFIEIQRFIIQQYKEAIIKNEEALEKWASY